MTDMLVRLYDLPPVEPMLADFAARGITVRRPRAYEKSLVVEWVANTFSAGWAGECDVCFARVPVSAHIATRDGEIIGFACHESTYRNFFGPVGVLEEYRADGLGKCLLLASLHAMRDLGYAYAIIGGPTDAVGFYVQAVGALRIDGSSPGIYVDRLRGSDS
jgi:GNAT superfamily N-acetyltransferase